MTGRGSIPDGFRLDPSRFPGHRAAGSASGAAGVGSRPVPVSRPDPAAADPAKLETRRRFQRFRMISAPVFRRPDTAADAQMAYLTLFGYHPAEKGLFDGLQLRNEAFKLYTTA